jgi:transposase InsO family protein
VRAREASENVRERQALKRQKERRRLEEEVRREAARFSMEAARDGERSGRVAERLKLSPRTLSQWRKQQIASPSMRISLRGRPLRRSVLAERREFLRALDSYGPTIGVAPLYANFPGLGRSEISDMLWRYRRLYRNRHVALTYELAWKMRGRVWAADHTELAYPITGGGKVALAVRDLASEYQVAWKGTRNMKADQVIFELEALFRAEGAPLVIKLDNGSGFIAEETKAFLDRWGVVVLYSPPYWPRFNGACESTLGKLKAESVHQAYRNARVGSLSSDDLMVAHVMSNQRRAKACPEKTREDYYSERRSISSSERESFLALVDEKRMEVVWEKGYSRLDDLPHRDRAGIERVAISRALEARGILQYKRRRISLPIKTKRRAKIS